MTYTSGSTGRPKGILAHHGGAADYLSRILETYGITEADVVLQLAPLTFDASLRDTFGPLAAGARLVVVPDDVARDPEALQDRMAEEGVTCLLSIVPSLLRQLAAAVQEREARKPSWWRSRRSSHPTHLPSPTLPIPGRGENSRSTFPLSRRGMEGVRVAGTTQRGLRAMVRVTGLAGPDRLSRSALQGPRSQP